MPSRRDIGDIRFVGRVEVGTPVDSNTDHILDVAAANVRLTNFKLHAFTRTLPTVVNDYIMAGAFYPLLNGAAVFDISLVIASAGFSVTKFYRLAIQYDQTGTGVWATVLPLSDTGPFGGNDVALDAKMAEGILEFRIRRTAGSTAGTAYMVVTHHGVNTDLFNPNNGTGSTSAPTAFLSSTPLTAVGHNVGLRTSSDFGGGVGVLGIANRTTAPSSNPTGGIVLYAEAGVAKVRGSAGVVTLDGSGGGGATGIGEVTRVLSADKTLADNASLVAVDYFDDAGFTLEIPATSTLAVIH